MPTDLQLLKAYGHMPNIELRDANRAAARSAVREEQYGFLAGRLCAHPDDVDPELADAAPEDVSVFLDMPYDEAEGIVEAHQRMMAFNDSGVEIGEAYNNAKWPRGCHAEWPKIHAVKVFVDWKTCPAHNMRLCTSEELDQIVEAGVFRWTRAEVQELFGQMPMAKVALELAFEAYRVLGCLHVEIDDGVDGDEHQIHITFRPIAGSTIGIGWFPNGQCGDHVNQHIDTIRFSLIGLARLFAHELGHNHGEPHQFTNQGHHRSVMSYNPPRLFYGFSTGKAPHSLPRDRSLDSLEEKYGGKPVSDGNDEPEPPPPPIGAEWETLSTWEVAGDEYRLQRRETGTPGGVWR